MKNAYPLEYELSVEQGKYGVVEISTQTKEFTSFACEKGVHKIYGIFEKSPGHPVCIYVGTTMHPMKARLDSGLLYNKSYQWIPKAAVVKNYYLLVWNISGVLTCKEEAEAIEAELSFCVRVMQRGWPKYQTGIMFRHIVDSAGWPKAQGNAIDILSHVYRFFSKLLSSDKEREALYKDWEKVTTILLSRTM